MKEVNQFKISEASSNDYAEIVDLFNKNQVYQFPDGISLNRKRNKYCSHASSVIKDGNIGGQLKRRQKLEQPVMRTLKKYFKLILFINVKKVLFGKLHIKKPYSLNKGIRFLAKELFSLWLLG